MSGGAAGWGPVEGTGAMAGGTRRVVGSVAGRGADSLAGRVSLSLASVSPMTHPLPSLRHSHADATSMLLFGVAVQYATYPAFVRAMASLHNKRLCMASGERVFKVSNI